MATLQIKKKSLYTWLHIDSELGEFILSKFEFSEDGTKFQIVENNGAKRRIYDVTDIEVFDIAGGAETFVSITDLSLRLEELKYPAFNLGGTFVFDPANYDLSEFTNTEVDRFARLSDITSGITTTVTTITSTNLTRQDATGLATYLNGVPSFNVPANDRRLYVVSDTGQIFELLLHGVNIGSGETPVTASDFLELKRSDLQARFFNGDRYEHQATGGAISSFGWAAPTTVGSGSNVMANFAGTYTSAPRNTWNRRVTSSAATPGVSAEFYNATRQSAVGLGFYQYMKCAVDTSTNSRFFIGIDGNTGASANADPSTLTDIIGFGKDSSDTHVQLIHNDNAGTATKEDLGSSFNIFGALPNDQAKDFEVEVWNFYGSTDVFLRITNLKNQSVFFKKVSTDLPGGTVGLNYRIWSNTGTDSIVTSAYFSNIKALRAS